MIPQTARRRNKKAARERLRRELTDETEEEDPGYVRQQIVP